MQPGYSCAGDCGRKPGTHGDLDVRASMRCSLPDFGPTRWAEKDRMAATEARTRAAELVDTARAQGVELGYDFEVDGCPWGWAQCRFVSELWSYVGKRELRSSVRSPSLRLQRRMMRDEHEPRELLAAVEYAEACEDGCYQQLLSKVGG